MVEFDETTDSPSRAQGCPVVVTTELDEQVSGKEGFLDSLSFPANDAFTDELGVKDHVILLQQVEVGTLILTWLAL